MAKGNLGKIKNVSNEDLAIMVAKGFADISLDLKGVKGQVSGMSTRLSNLEEKIRLLENNMSGNTDLLIKVRQEILDLGVKFVSRQEFERLYKDFRSQLQKLEIRVDRLMKK
jgi:predicted  nucleic acid-binding Zn-ribbon protein